MRTRTTSRIGPVIGRLGQQIKFKGTTLYPASFQHILDQIMEVETYYIEVTSNEYNEDQVSNYCIRRNEKILLEKLVELFRSHLRVVPEIEFRPASFINHIRNVPELRKPRIFIDNRL